MSYTPGYSYPFPTFQPAMRTISEITNANPAVVTTYIDHQYITGTIVRLIVPPGFGMLQANQLTGAIIVLTHNTFSINIDTTNFDIFILPSLFPEDYYSAQVVPIGEDNGTLLAATNNVLPY